MYYIDERTYGSTYPTILSEAELEAARNGETPYNPDCFAYLCNADTDEDAMEYYYTEIEESTGENIRPGPYDCKRDYLIDMAL